MNISKVSINRPVTTIMLVFVILLVGTVSLLGLPMDLLPEIELPMAIVIVDYPNAAPEEVETMVTKPMEQALASVENMDSITSMTTEGRAIVMVEFTMKTDMDFATLDMREKIAMIQGFLPASATDPMVIKMSMDFTPVVAVYVSGDKPLAELNREVEDSILSYFERSAGVASVDMFGGVSEEIAINFNQETLSGYGLSLSTVSQLLAAENVNMPGGDVSKGTTKVIVRTLGEFRSIDEIMQMPIPLADRSVVRLSELATIERGYQEQTSISRVDGVTAIGISVSKQSTANTVDVSDGIANTLDTLRLRYPDLTFTVGFDQADYIRGSVTSVAQSALIGAFLAILVIFFFLRSMSSTMIIAISIPTSFFATFALMNLTGMTLNLITLSALTLAVGMLVDNSIVALENIYRVSREEGGRSSKEAALIGSKQIALAVSASTLTSVVVYLPIALSGGIASVLFADFCWTFIISLMVSLLVAISVVPMLSSKLLDRTASPDYLRIGKHHYRYRFVPYFTKFLKWLTDAYIDLLRKALAHRKKAVIICLIIFLVSSVLVGVVGMEFMPEADEAAFSINVKTPYGTSLEEKDRYMMQVEEYILTLPELKHCSIDIGQAGFSGMGGGADATMSITLVPKQDRKRSIWEIMDATKEEFESFVGAEVTLVETSSVNALLGGSDIALSIRGPELPVLREVGEDLALRLLQIPGVKETSTSIQEGNPEVRVILDRNTASFYGVNAYQLATGLESSLNGTTATRLKVDGDEIQVNLSLTDAYGASIDNMKQILIPTITGGSVPVGQIATLEFGNSPTRIDRINQERYLTVDVTIEGDDLAAVSDLVFSLVNEYPFPAEYSYVEGGLYEQMIEAFGDLFLALVVAILLVYMVLASQFESLTQPFIVMIAIPFAMSGSFIALFLTGKTLSITSFLGLIMLVGIVVNNSILIIEFIRQNKDTMDRDQALIQAGKTRLRPILMTTLTTCFGMIPLSLGFSDGGEMMSPLGVSIIGGLLGSTAVTLLLVPVLYAIADDSKNKRIEKKNRRDAELHHLIEKWNQEGSHGNA